MRLKRLELFGFKSFADRRVLDFQHGLTGIVGPNGCGKSNVVDAVRWVLGERRPTSMRGAEMTDVIFKGSSSRPAMSVAEVTLVLDNECGTIEDAGAEVSVTRRVFKSGEGEYLIDGSKVRLKDLRDMLFDTGLGSRGYAILEQGKIDAVLSADALERRSIFEEAAGISRFRQRKKEAESRLKSVAADMTRLDDVVRELERRQRSLKIQAGKAERFIEARDLWQEQGVRYARHRFAELSGELTSLGDKLETLSARNEELRTLREAAEGDVAAREREQLTLTAELERLSATVSQVAGDLRALDERRKQLTARVFSWKESASQEHARIEALSNRQSERQAELQDATDRHAELERDAAEAEARVATGGVAAREAFDRFREARAAFAEQNELVLGLLHRKNEAQNSRRHLEASLEPLAARAARGKERLDEARANLSAARTKLGADRLELETSQQAATEAEARRADFEQRAIRAREQASEAAKALQAMEIKETSLQSRVESLRDWDAERAGLEAGARALFDKRQELGLADDLAGIVADHLTCRPEFAVALGAALGPWAEAVVLTAPERAGDVFAWLRAGEIGRARLAVQPERRPVAPLAVDLNGTLGRLIDHVVAAPAYAGLRDELCGDVVLCADLAAAQAFVARERTATAVTMAGETVTSAGLFGGASGSETSGAVARRSQATAFEGELASVREELETTREAALQAATRVERLTQETSAAREAAHEASSRARTLEGTIQATARRVNDLEQATEVLEHETAALVDERARVETSLRDLGHSTETLLAEFDLENKRLDELDQRRKELEGARDDASRKESQARVEWTRIAGELAGEKRRVEHLKAALEEIAREMERTTGLISASETNAVEGSAELDRLGQESADKLALRGELEAKLGELRERDREGRAAVEELRRRADAVTRELEGLLDVTGKRQLERQRVELAREEILRRSDEELGLDFEGLTLEFAPDEDLQAAGALAELAGQVAELKRSLERLGPVNLEAVNELEEVTERFEFLTAQRKDLAESRQSLEAAIRQIDEESERLFLEAFAEIRGNFQGIFRKLFGGGKADIILDPDLPPLEAGIEIYARPPGRENLPIGLLSGGQRTMIALALLFGVFQARPSPFCMLDEVDAALDDANIERFLLMLGLFRDMSQFIVVTHNKGTMTACDALYGITMQPRGISRHVVMQLADVDEFVPDADGQAPQEMSHELAETEGAPGDDLREDEADKELTDGREREEDPADANGFRDESDEPVHILTPVAREAAEDAEAELEEGVLAAPADARE
jgi:chromosome segregation protein